MNIIVFDNFTNNFTLSSNFTISANNFTISTNKRTKEARQSDEIHENDVRPRDVKQVVLSEVYSQDTNPNYKHSRPQHNEFGKYINYDKYGKQHNHNSPKYSKKDRKTQHGNGCEKAKHRCTAFLVTTKGQLPSSVYMTQSVNGSPLVLASNYVSQYAFTASMFSNKARGAYCPDYDFGVNYHYANGTQTVARFRHDGQQANRLYETAVDEINFYSNLPLVTEMSTAKGIYSSDAYNIHTNNISNTVHYQQHNVNSKSGAFISTIFVSNMCTDIYFFDNKCSRWLCFGSNPESIAYLRDPSTDTNYIPPKDNNPVPNVDIRNFIVFSSTSARTCGTQYMSAIGKKNPDATVGDVVDVQFVRAKVSLKYPYFEDIETFYATSMIFDFMTSIHSPPDTDIVYACFADTFWRFDMAYTAEVPVVPTVELSSMPWEFCQSITSFRECSDEVYVRGHTDLWYSRNGGRSFAIVDTSNFSLDFSHGVSGLAIPIT